MVLISFDLIVSSASVSVSVLSPRTSSLFSDCTFCNSISASYLSLLKQDERPKFLFFFLGKGSRVPISAPFPTFFISF